MTRYRRDSLVHNFRYILSSYVLFYSLGYMFLFQKQSKYNIYVHNFILYMFATACVDCSAIHYPVTVFIVRGSRTFLCILCSVLIKI